MAWDRTKPPASGFLNSAEIRANFQALEASLYTNNWFLDPGMEIWPAETSNGGASQTTPPAHYTLAGTGATVQRCGAALTDTHDYDSGGFATKLNYGSATAYLSQTMLDNVPGIFDGEFLGIAAAVHCSSSNAARLFLNNAGGTGYEYSDYHTGGGDWEWLTAAIALDSGATSVTVGLELSSGSAYIQAPTAVLGQVPPLYPRPGMCWRPTIGFPFPGTFAVGYSKLLVGLVRPSILDGASAMCYTQPSGSTAVFNVRHHDGSTWQDALASDLSVSSGNRWAHTATPDTVYRWRCFNANVTGTGDTDKTLAGYCVSNGGSGGDATLFARLRQFLRPQEGYFSSPVVYS